MKKKEYIIKTNKINDNKNIVLLSNLNIFSSKRKLTKLINVLNEINPFEIIINDIDQNSQINNYILSFISDMYNVIYISHYRNKLYKNNKLNILSDKNSLIIEDICFNMIKFKDNFHLLDDRDKLLELIVEYKNSLLRFSNILSKKYNILISMNPLILDAIKIYNNVYDCNINFDLIISSTNKLYEYEEGIINYETNKYIICEEYNSITNIFNNNLNVIRLLKK